MRAPEMDRVVEIERASFPAHAWTEENFQTCQRDTQCRLVVIDGDPEDVGSSDKDRTAVGFIAYGVWANRAAVLNLAVDPSSRRLGYGSKLLAETSDLIRKRISRNCTGVVTICVKEQNLQAQLFLRANGFRAIGTIQNHYPDGAMALQFTLRISKNKWDPRNRVADFFDSKAGGQDALDSQ